MAASPKDRMRAMRDHQSPARRRPGESNASSAGDVEGKVRVTVDLPASLHRALRVRVAEDGVDAQTFIRALLTQALKR